MSFSPFFFFNSLSDSLLSQVAFHTHFNHPNEITWATKLAARKLFARGVTTRNQAVLLRGVNNDVETLGTLIKELADLNVQPVRLSSFFSSSLFFFPFLSFFFFSAFFHSSFLPLTLSASTTSTKAT